MSWEMVKLGDYVKLTTGKTPPTSQNQYFEGDVLWVTPSDFKAKLITETSRTLTNKAIEDKKCNYLPPNTVLLSCIGDIGKVAILKNGGTTNQQITALIPSKNLNADYLYYCLLNSRTELNSLANNAVVPILNNARLNTLEIPLPPLSTQQRIAEILDKADALRRKDQALLKKYDDLAQAIFMDMFGDPVKNEMGWEIVELASLCSDIIDCPHSTPNHSDSETEFPCIRTSEMKNGRIVWDSMKYLNEEEYHIRTKRLTPKFGDIVYAREGRFGEAILIPEQKKFALGQRTMLLRVNSNICDVLFLWYQLNSRYVYSQALKKTNGSTVGHINVSDVKTFSVLFPNLELQKKFSERISVITKSFENILNQVKYSEILFQSLLQQAFKGDLV